MFSLLIFGCSQKYNEYAKPTDILREQALTLTQNVIIKKEKIVRAFIGVTYINKINHELIENEENIEKFIVSVHIPSDQNKKLYDNVSFNVNGKKTDSITLLSSEDKLLKILPASIKWNKYFLVKSPKDEKKRGISFEVSVGEYKSPKINFSDSYGNLPY